MYNDLHYPSLRDVILRIPSCDAIGKDDLLQVASVFRGMAVRLSYSHHHLEIIFIDECK
ncbi:hypothetical protein [Candidatus Ichthyocystis hellenicum]|uniref:hypothetical protein n=1 Tax=Candidatus Ichthyocystis hellenicum TaxID=1561003 RepID=UPI0015852B0B|nr:hypothetical protein [Candidatus Ichthyocystis hellenicum]